MKCLFRIISIWLRQQKNSQFHIYFSRFLSFQIFCAISHSIWFIYKNVSMLEMAIDVSMKNCSLCTTIFPQSPVKRLRYKREIKSKTGQDQNIFIYSSPDVTAIKIYTYSYLDLRILFMLMFCTIEKSIWKLIIE